MAAAAAPAAPRPVAAGQPFRMILTAVGRALTPLPPPILHQPGALPALAWAAAAPRPVAAGQPVRMILTATAATAVGRTLTPLPPPILHQPKALPPALQPALAWTAAG